MPCTYFLIYVIIGTAITGQIVCLGNSLAQILDGTHIRQARSPHHLYRRMCPYGSNRESCFYSQLSMFMRLHDSIGDPVHMRNIGKRSGGGGVSGGAMVGSSSAIDDDTSLRSLESYPDMLVTDDSIDSQDESNLADTPFGNEEMDLSSGSSPQSKLTAQSFGYLTQLRDLQNIDNLLKMLPLGDATRSQGHETKRSDDVSSSAEGAQYISSPRKRQLICPRGISRTQCYDKALAFYMRLLRTMGDQK